MDRFDDMRARVSGAGSDTGGGSGGGGGETGGNGNSVTPIYGTPVTIEPTESLSKGDRFVGVKNGNANLQMAYAGIGSTNMCVVSEDLSVGLVATTLSTEATSLQIGFLTDDYYYELVDVPIPSGMLTNSIALNSTNASINEDGEIIAVRNLYDDNGKQARVMVISVNKTSKTATIDYKDNFGVGNYQVSDGGTSYIYDVTGITRTGTKGMWLTNGYLIYTFTFSVDYTQTRISDGEKNSYNTSGGVILGIYKYNGSTFTTKPVFSKILSSAHPILADISTSADTLKASGWYDDNTLIFISGTSGSGNNVGSLLHKVIFSGGTAVSHSYINIAGTASYTSSTVGYTMSKNGMYINRRAKTSSNTNVGAQYKLNPLDMTLTQISSTNATHYYTSDGEYYLSGSGIFRTDDGTQYMSAKAIGSRYFEFTAGRFYRSSDGFKCFLSPISNAEYIVSANYGDCTTDGNIYGIVNENLNAGEKGTGQLLFTSGVVGTGTSDIEGVVSPPRFINHIEFTGTQYIDTGLPVAPNFYVYTDFLVSSAPDSNGAVIIGTANSNNYRFWTLTVQQALTMNCGLINNCVSTKTIELNKRHHAAVKFFNSDQQLYVNDELYCSATNTANSSQLSSFASLSNLRIGAKVYNATNGFFKGKIYAFKIYDENKVLIRDFKPAIYNNKYCLYDVVESKPYYNAGTGEFMGDGEFKEMVETDIPEPDNTPTFIDYIESSGTQYVDTGITSKTGIKVVMDAQITTPTTSVYLYGARVASASQRNDLMEYYSGGHKIYYYYSNNGYNGVAFSNIGVNIQERNIYETLDGKLVINGATCIDKTGTNFESNLTMFIFCTNNNGTPYGYSYLKLYSCKIYDGDTLVRDFRPAMVRNNYCLYDMVESKPYFNAGTGSFTGA